MGVGRVVGGPVGGAPLLEDETKVCQTLRRGALTSTKLFTLTEGAVCTNNWLNSLCSSLWISPAALTPASKLFNALVVE